MKSSVKYIDQVEADLVKKLQGPEDAATIVRWVTERVLESYRNGISAGRKGAVIKRNGESRRPSLPSQAL